MTSEEQELARRKIYQALIEQGMTTDPQQVVSGRVVPYSPIQGLSKLAQAYLGRHGLDQLEATKAEEGKQSAQAYQDALTTMQGIPGQAEGSKDSGINQLIGDERVRPSKREAIAQALIEKQIGLNTGGGSAYTRSQYEKRGDITGLATYDGRTGQELSFDPGRIPVTQDPTNRGAIKKAEGEAVVPSAVDKAEKIAKAEAAVELATKPGIQQAVKSAEEVGKAEGGAKVELPSVENSSMETIDLVDQLIAHPGMKDVVGLPDNPMALKGYTPGTEAADFKSRLDQLTGRTFLEVFPTLKGGGQITEIEGSKGQDAINRMSTATSEKDFVTAANDFKAEINRLRDVVRTRAGKPSEKSSEQKKRLKYNRETGMME